MNKEMMIVLKKLLEKEEEEKIYSEEDKIKAAYALNMCMVSVSQIIDYNDIYILEQEYDAILNNINLEMIPKDEALLEILKRVLDTITFFRMSEGDKKILEKEYQQRMANAIWDAVPNFGLIVSGGNPVNLAISLASQVGIGYMNYRRAKAENKRQYEKNLWQLQKSAMEQFNGLRRELFDTAWRLADTYRFPDEYRLTERQIKQYDDILMDVDLVRKYERLTTIKGNFVAYPPFWYHYGSTANQIARDKRLKLSDESRKQYMIEAKCHFDEFWEKNKYMILREDHMVSACALEHIDLLDINEDRRKMSFLLDSAVRYSGNANDILQLCAVAYLRIGEKEKASDIFRILVNEQYNLIMNAQLLSGLYVNKVLESEDFSARRGYEALALRVDSDYLIRLPQIGENVDEGELKHEFSERQESILIKKYVAVINQYFFDLSIRMGKIKPVPNPKDCYSENYFSKEGNEQRKKDFMDLFSSSIMNKRKKGRYIERLSESDLLDKFFKVINSFFHDILELSCIRDRQELEGIIKRKLLEYSKQIKDLAVKIDEGSIEYEDMLQLLELTSIDLFSEFIDELEGQITETVCGMNDMSKYAMSESKLNEFCCSHGIPEPGLLIEEGIEANTDLDIIPSYFELEKIVQSEREIELSETQNRFREIEHIIRYYRCSVNTASEKTKMYFYNSEDFITYFEASTLKEHKDILKNTIAIYDDKTDRNVDVLFTVEGLVPIVRNSVKKTIPYLYLCGDEKRKEIVEMVNRFGVKMELFTKETGGPMGLANIMFKRGMVADTRAIKHVISEVQDMIDEICELLVKEEFNRNKDK